MEFFLFLSLSTNAPKLASWKMIHVYINMLFSPTEVMLFHVKYGCLAIFSLVIESMEYGCLVMFSLVIESME